MKKIFLVLSLIIVGLIVVYFLGPKPRTPSLDAQLPVVPSSLKALEASIIEREQSFSLKPDNEGRIVWADSIPKKTPYSVIYLHGYTATYMEGEPVHRNFARRYGCNLYLPRLDDHGLITPDPLINISPDSLFASACHALAVGLQLGEKVILMSTSTGSTLSLLLAAKFPDQVEALITYSPNIRIAHPNASLMTRPWGLHMARAVVGSKFRTYESSDSFQQYWYTSYRLEGAVQVQKLVETSMTPELFASVTQPFFMGYYYKNEEEQDKVVSVPAMLEMFAQLGTPPDQKREIALPSVGRHALASELSSLDIPKVCEVTYSFAEEVLNLSPIKPSRND
jgi:pimeloyl-ACP methyl ester carboxylesterase